MCLKDFMTQLRIGMMNRTHESNIAGMGPVLDTHHFQLLPEPMKRGSWPKQANLLEDLGLRPESIKQQYTEAIDEYCYGLITHEKLKSIMGAKNVLS